jgi:hypothetical protein
MTGQRDWFTRLGAPSVKHKFRRTLLFPVRLERGSRKEGGAVARGAERSETTRVIAGDGPDAANLPEARFAGSNRLFPCPNSHWRAPQEPHRDGQPDHGGAGIPVFRSAKRP